jgi:lipopolysaccharide biosynthesis glycosyltransferase
MHVALTFDDNYWAPAYAVMRSVCLATKRRQEVTFHLFVEGVSAAHRTDLERIPTEFGARLAFYDLTQDAALGRTYAGMRQSRRFPRIVAARLLIDRFLPAEVERVVYLDCDTLVLAPIERLFDHDLGGLPIAAVREPFGLHIKMGRDMRRKQEMFDAAEPYFNSGVMLIDVARYAAADIPAQIAGFEQRGILKRLYYDQDILNLVFAGRWHELEWRFNVLEGHEAHHAMGVHIVHYSDRRRPWHLFSSVPFHRTYRHVMTNELFYRYARHRWRRAVRRLLGRG